MEILCKCHCGGTTEFGSPAEPIKCASCDAVWDLNGVLLKPGKIFSLEFKRERGMYADRN